MTQKHDIEALLKETAQYKTNELHLDALLVAIKTQAGAAGAAQTHTVPVNARRKLKKFKPIIYIAAAAAGILLLITPLLRNTVIVEGKPYIALGNTISIDGDIYYLEAPDIQKQEAELLHVEGTNQYVKLPTKEEGQRIMIFPPDSGPQPERKPTQPAAKNDIYTAEPVMVYPTIPGLVVRGGPGTQYEELAQLYTGECVYKVGMHGDWAILEWQGRIAYAYGAYLFEAPENIPTYPPVPRYATEPVNVRMMPGSRDASIILGELDTDQEVQCTGVIGGWSQIEWNGAKAYVFSQHLSKQPTPAAG